MFQSSKGVFHKLSAVTQGRRRKQRAATTASARDAFSRCQIRRDHIRPDLFRHASGRPREDLAQNVAMRR